MADPTYGPKVYQPHGGDTLVVANGGKIKIETGGAVVPNSGTQASAIAAVTGTAGGTYTATEQTMIADLKTALNAALAALAGAGIIAP